MTDLHATLISWLPYMIPLPVILPALGAAAALLVGRRPSIQRVIAISVFFALIVLNLTMVFLVDLEGIQTIQIGGWDAPVGITLVADRLSTLMLTVSSLVLFAVMLYAIGQGLRDGLDNEPITVFLSSYLLLTMGINVSFLAGDLFNLYVGFEIFLVASYVLLTLSASPARVRAGVGYVMVSMASSVVFLIGIALVYAAVGTVNMAHISERIADIPSGTQSAIFAVLLVAFGIKAAVFPLDSWLPDSYPTAPALVTAVFAGLLTKVGVYSIIRMRSTVFTDGALDTLLMFVAIATMLVGILGAMAQSDIKRLLSFTLVSHIGYMIFGVALGTAQGLSGAIFYAVHHILVQTALFLVVGLIERQAGSSSLRRLGSLAKGYPLIALLYLIPALNLGGIPPFSGFLGKIMLLEAGAEKGGVLSWLLIAGAIITSLLTLYTMVLVWAKAFWRDRKDAPEGSTAIARPALFGDVTEEVELDDRDDVGRMPVGMVAATAMLVILSVGVTFIAGPLSNVTTRAAESAQDPSGYRRAVLGEDYSNPGRSLEQSRLDDGQDSLDNRISELTSITPTHYSTTRAAIQPSSPHPSATQEPEELHLEHSVIPSEEISQ
ncbi:Na(+)/H(+) antiporter subunit D [Corynebacterium kutscheri]|uniref:Formate hydrogenlyase subunit 3/multisubunit Na+/H+ antiporter, MnhD subunit n=1 Tax=Corynebacterium kutscheri TaxID=35755 RepID=A0A0F6TDZ9_9CORY|nr:Na+/H+ antiporter subunit D [Corynebacterium kutscheri]AKE41994.1 formate hydrogenlyase subunit 3/multisubunit Na+/H+ antiporter, MnhD subunit [Corynebacterium kutscheri]VEH06202.1 Na(+)/H(+) antiporter subunit D [Corynebacterium kutscheri]VEH10335.1 Na(+)/H(+) antiporter subunit D [Corynebacterium kutscheri]VEH82118.1 Na(+)/H(+) antiporter subunit D [Corynebacterium kutscheri]